MIYEINLSKGAAIKIDQDDLDKIKANIDQRLVIVKQGIINPAFIVTIVPTEQAEFQIKPIIKVEDGVAKIIGEDKIPLLDDVMTPTKKLQ